ncbi:AF4/FMR2 family member 1-like [Aplochiton taeniatus]
MASRPSLYNEERNLLRIRERERRNQETIQDKEIYPENVPLFREPYKTNKGDELSSRIQRMLGSYEDVSNPSSGSDLYTKDPPSTSSHVAFGRTPQGRPAPTDKSAKPPFQNPSQPHTLLASGGGSSSTHSSQPPRKPPGPATHQQHHGPSSSYTLPILSQGALLSPIDTHQSEGEAWPDLRECARLPPVLSALSPPGEPMSPLHSIDSDHQDTDDKDTPERLRPPGHPAESPGSAADASPPLDPQRSPGGAPPPAPASEGSALPSQTFPPPLASKLPNLAPKPTAYVRPMDGQDQVLNVSPDLKHSPEDFHGQPYEAHPDLKGGKPSLSKLKMPSQSLETLSNEAQCVEDILKEMTHSWPPLLTAIQTPSTAETPKFSFPAKEPQHVPPAYPGQKHHGSSPAAPSSLSQQTSSSTVAAAHSSGVESASSSDSESSSGSESDSESGPEEPPRTVRSSSPVAKPEVPTGTHGDWQLANWIRSSQQSSSTDSQADAVGPPSPARKQPLALPPTPEAKRPEFGSGHAKPLQQHTVSQENYNQHGRPKSPSVSTSAATARGDASSQRKTVGNKHPSKPAKAPRPEDTPQVGLKVETVEVVTPRHTDPSFPDRPKVKTKTEHGRSVSGSGKSSSSKADGKKAARRCSSDTRKPGSESGPRVTLVLEPKREAGRSRSPSPGTRLGPVPNASAAAAPPPSPLPPPPPLKISSSVRTETISQKSHKKPSNRSLFPSVQQPSAKGVSSTKAPRAPHKPLKALLVKIELSLLSRVPLGSKPHRGEGATTSSRKKPAKEKGGKGEREAPIPTQTTSSKQADDKERKRCKKAPGPAQLQPATPQDQGKPSASLKRPSEDAPAPAPSPAAGPPRDSHAKHKKSTGKRTERPKTGKKGPKSSFAIPAPAQPSDAAPTSRPLLKAEERKYPVEHHIKEAKKLKHKADATPQSDKDNKALNYLDAALSFVESGIAMETDPQTPKSAYKMFAETVELIRFILKLKNSLDPSASPTDKDFIVLCMRCQSLLQMAMFRYKREAALKYSRTLTDHFKSSSKSAQAPSPCVSKSTGTPSPMSPMPSPVSTSSSGPGSNHSSVGGSGGAAGPVSNTVAIPQVIQQVACSYVNITALFLHAHDMWEQAEELRHSGSGLLSELDSTLGPLSLTSSMSSLVHYTRQGLHWLRPDARQAQ